MSERVGNCSGITTVAGTGLALLFVSVVMGFWVVGAGLWG